MRRFAALLSLGLALLASAPAQAQGAAAEPATVAVELAPEAFQRGAPVPAWVSWTDTLPEARPADPMSLRLADTQLRVDAVQVAFVHRAMQVNAAAELGQIGQWSIDFMPDYQRVELHVLRLHRGGQVLDRLGSARIRFLRREEGAEQGVLSGRVAAHIVLEDVRVGDTLEIAYSTVGANPAFAGRYFDAAFWEAQVPVSYRRVLLSYPADRRIAYRVIGGAGAAPRPVERERAGRREMVFETRGMPAVEPDPGTPGDEQALAWLQFSELDDWAAVNRWALGLFRFEVTPQELEPLLGAVRAGKTAEDKVRRALAFVQQDIRYLSLAFGENSHRPFAPREVLQRRFGDCKDKSLLLVAVLRQVGIDAAPVLVSNEMRSKVDTLLPSPLDFDHAIVRVRLGERDYFLDPTLRGQASRLERLGQWHAGSRVLVVAPGTRALTTVPAAGAADLTEDRREDRLEVTGFDQPARLRSMQVFGGIDAESLRDAIGRASPSQIAKGLSASTERRHPGAELVGAPDIRDDKENNLIRVGLDFKLPRYVERDGEAWVARFSALNMQGLFALPDRSTRTWPVAITRAPMTFSYSLELVLPENVDARRQPDTLDIEDAVFRLHSKADFQRNKATLQARLETLRDRLPAADVAPFLATVRRVNTALAGAFVIRPGDLRQEQRLPYADDVRQQIEKVVSSTSESLASRRLSGADRGAVLCERALARAYLGFNGAAREDADAALAQTPMAADALACHGRVLFHTGDVARGAQDLSRAIALQADPEWLFLRGVSNYYRGELKLAQADFARVVGAEAGESLRARARIWAALVQRRGGAPAPRPVAGKEDWLDVAQRLVVGQDSSEPLLDLIEREAPPPIELARAEAYFYVGQQALLAGNRIKASVFFKRVLAQGALHSVVNTAARIEIGRLDAAGGASK